MWPSGGQESSPLEVSAAKHFCLSRTRETEQTVIVHRPYPEHSYGQRSAFPEVPKLLGEFVKIVVIVLLLHIRLNLGMQTLIIVNFDLYTNRTHLRNGELDANLGQ